MMNSKMPIGIAVVFIFFFQPSFAQVPDYFGNNPVWHEVEQDYDQWQNPPLDIKYWPSGDTLIESFTYKKIYHDEFGWQSDTILFGFFRQVGRAIHYYDDVVGDSLFVSYEYNVGDFFGGAYGLEYSGASVGVVHKIDSVLIGAEYRRTFHIDTLGMNQGIAIEGIGYMTKGGCSGSMFREPMSFNGPSPYFGIGEGFLYNWTHKYLQNDIEIWNCASLASIENQPSELNLSIYPNPFSEYTTIKLPSNHDADAQLIFYNMVGEEILRISTKGQTQIQIDKSELPQGVYFVSILENNQTQNLGKVISL